MTKKTPFRHHNQVRIISGAYRGRFIHFINNDGLRPTPDRLRETLFNWLMGHLVNARVLDVCAGSGVLGFECLSRGAGLAVLIEPNATQAAIIQQNANTLHLTADQITIINATAQIALPKLTSLFDVVFIDPPYTLNLWQDLLNKIKPLCHQQTLIYIEGNRPLDKLLAHDNFTIIKRTKIGQIYAYLGQNNT